jgi:hypothetical protein
MTILEASKKWCVRTQTIDTWIKKGRIKASVVLGHYEIPNSTKCPQKLRAGRKVVDCPECGSKIVDGRCSNPALHGGGL